MSKVPGPKLGGHWYLSCDRPACSVGVPGQGARPAYLSLAVQSDLPIGLTRRGAATVSVGRGAGLPGLPRVGSLGTLRVIHSQRPAAFGGSVSIWEGRNE